VEEVGTRRLGGRWWGEERDEERGEKGGAGLDGVENADGRELEGSVEIGHDLWPVSERKTLRVSKVEGSLRGKAEERKDERRWRLNAMYERYLPAVERDGALPAMPAAAL
jgi:hypothetical protein